MKKSVLLAKTETTFCATVLADLDLEVTYVLHLVRKRMIGFL